MSTCGDQAKRTGTTLRFLGPALGVVLAGLLRAHAQEASGYSSIPISLAPESRNVFWIDANDAVTVTLHANRRDLRLIFKDPKGLVWEIAAPSAENEPSSLQTAYGTTIERPATGAWTLSVLSTEPVLDFPIAQLRVVYANQVHPRLILPRRTWVSGEALPLSLELMDGTTRVKGLRTSVTLARVDEPLGLPVPVGFHDDGLHGDRIAKDGLYTATVPAETPGKFRLEAQIEGIASTGRVHRTYAVTLKIVAKAVRITGNLNQRVLVGTPE